MKPLLRWTIGPVHPCGFDVLEQSVKAMKSLYDFDMVICYNQLDDKQLERLRGFDVELVDQSGFLSSLFCQPRAGYSVEWKLYPPRLRFQAHELFIDNDIVLHRKPPEISRWLGGNVGLLYQGLHGLHGSYAGLVPPGFRINSGIFGLPPHFDFEKKLMGVAKQWTGYFDEQGLVASTLLQHPFITIPLTVLPIVEPDWPMDLHYHNEDCCGFHFVHANRQEHPSFRKHMLRGIKL